MMIEQFKSRARGGDDMHPNTSARLFTPALLVRNQVPAGRARRSRYGVPLVNVSANKTFGSNYPEVWSLSVAINVGF